MIATDEPTIQKQSRPRTVFGRRRESIGGVSFVFEMRAGGLFVRRKFARSWRKVSFTDLVALSEGQFSFRL